MSIILLDIGNVLVTVDFMRFCRAVAIDMNAGPEEIFRKYCAGELKEKLETGWIGPLEYLAMIARDPQAKSMSLNVLKQHWQDIFEPLEGAVEAVRYLKEKHSLWIMSDTDPLHFTFLLNNYPLLRSADRYYLSFEHGKMKTSVEAFSHVLDSSRCGAEEFILIDDKEENGVSAAKAGIRSILFQSWQDTLALF
ncbi:MAG: HAD family hydrolase [Chlorobiaceae bacterium]